MAGLEFCGEVHGMGWMRAVVALALVGAAMAALAGQQSSQAAGRDSGQVAGRDTAKDTATDTVTGLLQPSLDALERTIAGLKLEKWKGGSIRTEASTNAQSIQRDLQSTLPGLLKDADTPPQAVSKVLPVTRNVAALYDVVLRVYDGASVAAPAEQVTQLQQAMTGLNKARHALDDRLQAMAEAGEKQVGALQLALKAVPAPVCPVAATPAQDAAAKDAAAKKAAPRKKRKPAAAPAATPPAAAKPNP